MPTYGYQCGRCAHKFEVRQSMSDAPLKDCPECGGELLRRCKACGAAFSSIAAVDCDECGKPLRPDALFGSKIRRAKRTPD